MKNITNYEKCGKDQFGHEVHMVSVGIGTVEYTGFGHSKKEAYQAAITESKS